MDPGGLKQQSQCGFCSGAGVDEPAVPCQVPPEVFSLPQTDLPKSEGIALEMFSIVCCFFCRHLFYTLALLCVAVYLLFFDSVESYRDAFQRVSYSHLEQCFHNALNPVDFFFFVLQVESKIDLTFLERVTKYDTRTK